MILQELYGLAQRENLVPDPDFEDKPVAWLVRVGPGGELLGVSGTHQAPEPAPGRKPPRALPKRIVVPRQPGRTVNKLAFFLCDKSEYVFGMDVQSEPHNRRNPSELAARFKLFRDQVEACAAATRDEAVEAVAVLLRGVAAGVKTITLPPECKTNDLFAFVYAPDVDRCVHERNDVRAYWKRMRADSQTGQAAFRCVVTGAPLTEVSNFPLIKKVPGGSTSGVALVSFNKKAFESHGWDSNQNAVVSRDVAEACATALNRLVDSDPVFGGRHLPRRNIVVSDDTVVCFWGATGGTGSFVDALPFTLTLEDPGKVGDLYRSLWRGVPVGVDDSSAFFALTLSGTQGRAIVRDWFVSTVADVARNLARHFSDIAIAANRSAPRGQVLHHHLPLRALLASLAPPGRNEGTPPQLAAQFVSAALRGTDYPFLILQRALARTRAEIGRLNEGGKEGWQARERQDARAALIKGVLNRNSAAHQNIGVDMDPANSSPGYLLGRLMAVLERLQQVAMGDVNAGVVDRYFSAASASPKAVFVRLLKNARYHARKALDEPRTAGTAVWLERQIDAIAAPFEPASNGFPAFLDLTQQGLFVLGYHQQRHWLWQPSEDRAVTTSQANIPNA
jgi:CRISPR-associated protein Csd1